jgi:ketosteroid isomerase-like protein
MDTREVVERYYATVNAGDWETWLTVFDEHVVVDEQLAGHLEGVGAMREEADAIRAAYPKFRMDPEHVVVEGEEACAIWHCTAVSASGAPVDARGTNYFRVVGGRIAYLANFHDKGAFAPASQEPSHP